MKKTSVWPKKITVDKRIVGILSGATYDNFPKALKEIITNSYDADASEVRITIDEKTETIIVEDNGWGLSEEDFDFYLRIAGKSRTSREFTVSGRKRIGQFGVGFLSVFPFCKNYNIESKKKGSPEILFASIPNHRYYSHDEKLGDVDAIPIQGGKRVDAAQLNRQFTRIKLTGFTDLTKSFFKQEYYVQRRRDSILQYPAIKRLEWELCEDLPIEYPDIELNEKFSYKTQIPFRVYLNSPTEFLKRNLLAKTILETHQGEFEQIGKIKFKYFFATNYKPIKPVEGRYLKIRNFNVGVGQRRTFGVGLEGRTYARLAHLTGEIHILEGMNDLINVSRDDFNFSPDYEELQEFFRKKIRKWGSELDSLSDTEKFIKESEDNKPIRSLEALNKSNVAKKIDELEKKGFKISKSSTTDAPIVIDKSKKEIFISTNIQEEEEAKIIAINGKSFKLKVDSWDTENDDFPACKIKGKTITINNNYPLFSSKNKKHLDVFIKMHAIVLINFEEGNINSKTYKKLITDFEVTFEAYK